jgi:hypothetical protein
VDALRHPIPVAARLAALAAACAAASGAALVHTPASVQAAAPPTYGERVAAVPAAASTRASRSSLDSLFASLVPSRATQLGLGRAHALTSGSRTVIVAVVDTGVNPVADLDGSLLPGADFAGDGAGTGDPNGHGTGVALAVREVCDCSILPVRVLRADDHGSGGALAQGIDWAVDHGASVINLSLNTLGRDDAAGEAVAQALARGVLVVVAAGNDGSSRLPYLASLPGVVSVGANDEAGNLAGYSNRGDWVDVAAPGCAVSPFGSGGTAWSKTCGTSFAAPAVSGAAALALTLDPSLDPERLAALIERSATPEPGVHEGRIAVDALLALVR